MVSGARKRMTFEYVPELSMRSPFCNARCMSFETSSVAGAFVFLSVTNSIPIIAPIPRMSPMTSYFSAIFFQPSVTIFPIWRAFAA